MKTKELIRQLQKEDPEGEFEVCVGNEPISYAGKYPSYYDGRLQVLERDDKNQVISAKYVANTYKIQIRIYNIEDAIWDNPDLPVDTSQDISQAGWVEETRKEAKKFEAEHCTIRKK